MRGIVTSSVFSLLSVGLLTACPDRTISEVNPEQGRVEFKDIPVNLNRNVDILFVIDDSGSMADKQQNLRDNFPDFIDVLNTIQGGLPDVHIGVVSSDMGTKGEEDASPGTGVGTVGQGGCANTGKDGRLLPGQATGITGTFISDIKLTDGSRQKNYDACEGGNLAACFGKMASLGATGCGFEQHLAAMRRALDNNPANAGFIRQDAFLAVIFLADEDDCSMSRSTLLGPDGGPLGPQQSFRCTRFGVKCDIGGTSDTTMNQVGVKSQCHPDDGSVHVQKVSKYVDFLKGLKDDDSKIIVAGIMGTNEPFAIELQTINGQQAPGLAPSCTYEGADGVLNTPDDEKAVPPTRLSFFLNQFPNRSQQTSICKADLSDGLDLIGELLKAAIGNPCIEGNLAQPFECTVSYVNNFGQTNQTETVLPPCQGTGPTSSNQPCWEIIVDVPQCPGGNNQVLKVNDPSAPPQDTHIIANCVTTACVGAPNGVCDPNETQAGCPEDCDN